PGRPGPVPLRTGAVRKGLRSDRRLRGRGVAVAPGEPGGAPRLVRALPGGHRSGHAGEVTGHTERQPPTYLAGALRLLLGRPPGLVLLRGARRHTRSFTVRVDHHQTAPRRCLYGHPRERRPMGPQERSITL